jgi:hypothetical protein
METYLRDADEIWSDFNLRSKNSDFEQMDTNGIIEFYQKRNEKFAMTFPIVLRYMVQLNQYNRKAFERFIKKLTSNPYRTEMEYCERQADYIKYLYMEQNTHYKIKNAQVIWQQAYDMLAEEVKMFKEADKIVKQKLENSNNKNRLERREELREFLKTNKNI